MKLVYLGTPEMAVPPLQALVAAGHEVRLVITGPDRRRGRGAATSPSPVGAAANELGIPVSHEISDVIGSVGEVDLGVVVAFGQLIHPNVFEAVPLINLHFSLLPRWRGAAPVERAILAGDTETGVCVMDIEEGLDTGGVYARVVVPVGPTVTAAELRAELVTVGSQLLVDTLDRGLGEPEPQTGEVTYARKFINDDFRIDWTAEPQQIDRLIRVGRAWTTFRGERVKVHAAHLDDGELVISEVQPAGKPRMEYVAWRNGAQPEPGEGFE